MWSDEDHARYQRLRDEEHLSLLGIFNYVSGGFCLLASLLAVPHLIVIGMLDRRAPFGIVRDLPRKYETFFLIVLGAWIAICVIAALFCFVNARCLRSHRNRTFSVVVAALQCVAMPLGTILGIFTIVVLGRPSVVELYGESPRR
jgi:hypothetical protein